MRNTWHFTLPKSLLLPTVDRLADQQRLSTLSSENLKIILTLFETFATFLNFPLGLNPKKRKLLRAEFTNLKQNPNTTIHELGALIKKMKEIKEEYQHRRQEALQKKLPLFVILDNDELTFVAIKILENIQIYIHEAKQELVPHKRPSAQEHPLNVFFEFIQKTETLLKEHQQSMANCMLLRLQEADKQHSLETLTPLQFKIFHQYIERYGDKASLAQLCWSKKIPLKSISNPEKPRWPTWFFRGTTVLYQAFGDTYHQTIIILHIQRLQTFDANNYPQLNIIREIDADVVLKATNVDGIYSEDPEKNANATLYEELSFQEALDKQLAVMDLAAFCQCRDHHMPLRVFNMNKPGALLRVVMGEKEGTIVR